MEYRFSEDFLLALEAFGMTSEQLCQSIGISRSYVNDVCNGKQKPGHRLLEAFYAYAYDHGLRINHSKEELFRERYGTDVLFHGSSHGLTVVSPRGSRADCDFGTGFYLGESYRQASSFIADAPEGSVYAFRLDTASLRGAKLATDLDWMLLICHFRGKLKAYRDHSKLKRVLEQIENADYIRAPIADNKMFQVMRLYSEGDINSEEALHALSASNLGEQIVLKTQAAVDGLSFIDRLYLCEPEKRYILSFTAQRAAEVETKLKMAKREYRDKGLFIDEVFS